MKKIAFGIILAFVAIGPATQAAMSDIESGPSGTETAIVLVHDWFGVTPFYEDAVNRLAGAGYAVRAIDLYNGRSAETHQEAWQLMSALDRAEAQREVNRAVEEAAEGGRNVIVVGFSLGADFAFTAATSAQADGLVIFYGTTPPDSEALARLEGPVLAIYGSLDGNAAEQAMGFSQAADEVGAHAEIHIFPQQHHAFAQPLFNAGETYDSIAAEAAWALTLDFLGRAMLDN